MARPHPASIYSSKVGFAAAALPGSQSCWHRNSTWTVRVKGRYHSISASPSVEHTSHCGLIRYVLVPCCMTGSVHSAQPCEQLAQWTLAVLQLSHRPTLQKAIRNKHTVSRQVVLFMKKVVKKLLIRLILKQFTLEPVGIGYRTKSSFTVQIYEEI